MRARLALQFRSQNGFYLDFEDGKSCPIFECP